MILRSQAKLGWMFRGSAYCQLIQDCNKVKRLQWAREYLQASQSDGFTDIAWTDERALSAGNSPVPQLKKERETTKTKTKAWSEQHLKLVLVSPNIVCCPVCLTCSRTCIMVFHSFLFRAKHPVRKVHIWCGISWEGRTPIVIFEGTMNAEGYENILWKALLPFL